MADAPPSRTAERWRTRAGVVVPAATAAQMAEAYRVAIEETGPGLMQMMEHAGHQLAREALALLGPAHGTTRVVVLAGAGANGGAGICAARHLANRGLRVALALTAPERLARAPLAQLRTFRAARGQLADPEEIALEGADLLLDALVGCGLQGAPREPLAALIGRINEAHVPTLALDVPTGLDADTGEAAGAVVHATRTLALALPKPGLAAPEAGDIALADLGLPAAVYAHLGLWYADPFGEGDRVPLEPA